MTLLRRPVLLLLIFLAALGILLLAPAVHAAGIAIDAANFPDAAFRAYVDEKFDTTDDGVLSDAEIAAVKGIHFFYTTASSLKGIEHFPNLVTLTCSFTNLTELDLSQNTALEQLFCNANLLTSLNVSGCTALTLLNCGDNQLTALDVSGCTALKQLDCRKNPLTSLNVTNTALTVLYCHDTLLNDVDLSSLPDPDKLSFILANPDAVITLPVPNSSAATTITLRCSATEPEGISLSFDQNSSTVTARGTSPGGSETVWLVQPTGEKGLGEEFSFSWNRTDAITLQTQLPAPPAPIPLTPQVNVPAHRLPEYIEAEEVVDNTRPEELPADVPDVEEGTADSEL